MTRLAHFTDLHVTEAPRNIPWPALFSKRVLGWANLRIFGRYRELAEAAEVGRALVNDLLKLAPDHILSTGDFTGLSLPSEYRLVRKVLDPLFGLDHVTAVPGNHDVYVRSAVRLGLYQEFFGEWTRSDLEESEYAALGSASYPYPLVRFLGDDAVLLCVQDARPAAFYDSSGKLPREQLEMLDKLLAHHRITSRVKLLAMHYGLRRRDGSRDTLLHRVRNDEQILRVAERHGVAMVMHGHLHSRFVHRAGDVASLAICNPGAVAYRGGASAYHIYDISRERIRLAARRYDYERGVFEAWEDAPGAEVVWETR